MRQAEGQRPGVVGIAQPVIGHGIEVLGAGGKLLRCPGGLRKRAATASFDNCAFENLVDQVHLGQAGLAVCARKLDLADVGPALKQGLEQRIVVCGLAKRFYVVLTRHDRSAFRPRVDFICGPGHLEGGDSRERAGLAPGGPKLVVSPLGVFDFEPTSKAMRVRSLNPGVTLEQVRDATAFDLVVDGTPPVTTMPGAQELSLLRSRVDTRRTLQRKFP